MAWILLIVAGLLETGWAIGLNTPKVYSADPERLDRRRIVASMYCFRWRPALCRFGTPTPFGSASLQRER